MPPPTPSTRPSDTTLVGLPTRLLPGQSGMFSADVVVAGVQVRLQAIPEWVWDPGDGTAPGPAATHTFRRRGTYRLSLETRWSARFDAAGVQGIPLGTPITQTAWIDLRVREARGFRQRRGA